MGIDKIQIIVGVVFIVVALLFRAIKLRKKILEKTNLVYSLGYCIFAYTSALVLVSSINLAILTFNDKLTIELIQQNKTYIFLAWLIIGLSSLVAFISLLMEEKKESMLAASK